MTWCADVWIRRTTIGCVTMLALIAGTALYLHMHLLMELHGQPGLGRGADALSVDGMIVARVDNVARGFGIWQPRWDAAVALLVIGSMASLAANVAVAELTVTGPGDRRMALVRADRFYELLMRQVRRPASRDIRSELANGSRCLQESAATVRSTGPADA